MHHVAFLKALVGQMEQKERVGTHVWNISLAKKLNNVNWLSGYAWDVSLNFSEL